MKPTTIRNEQKLTTDEKSNAMAKAGLGEVKDTLVVSGSGNEN